jgi:hypothetical protein
MRFLARIFALALATTLLAALGCRLLDPEAKGKSPLAPLQVSEDSVVLEIFFARFDYGYPPFAEKLWEQVDEQVVSTEIRRELSRHGFRVGVVGSQVPVELARLMTLTDTPQPQHQGTTVNLENEPSVKLRVLEVRSGRVGEVIASPVYDHLQLMMRKGDKVEGKTYHKADGRFVLKAIRHSDGRVGLDLLPEVRHGKAEQRWEAADGVFRLASSQQKRTFDGMHLKLDLSPGQMLLLTCRPDHPGSIGHYFFTEPLAGENLAQRMVIIRLATAGDDRAFSEIVSAEIDPATGQVADDASRAEKDSSNDHPASIPADLLPGGN